jgi:pectate lyase
MSRQSFISINLLLLATVFCLINTVTATADAPIGWAAVSGRGLESTTGGGDGKVVTAQTFEELAEYAKNSEPLTILVQGTLTGGQVNVASNKTILGLGADAKLIGVELNMRRVSNIIIRNLTISEARDGIATRGTHHVWIDHCDVSHCGDGAIDITHRSDFHTVSWTRLSNHNKTMLINSGTSQPYDAGTLNTTLHHIWWDASQTRNPRVGYGKVHVFNCLYNDNNYGIGLHSQCLVLAERNYFDDVNDPIHQMYRPDPNDIHHGFCESSDNIFANCKGDKDDEGRSFPVNEYYLYDFALDAAADVPAIIREKAGPAAQFGTLGPLPVPGNGAVNVGTEPTLRWTSGTAKAKSYKVAFGETNPPTKTIETSEKTFAPGKLKAQNVYYWRVNQVTDSGIVKGDLWRFRTGTAP